MTAMLAIIILIPLLAVPGFLVVRALLGSGEAPDLLERYYTRIITGTLLNGWLAFTLAELGIFFAWLHLLLIVLICIGAAALGYRRGTLLLPPLGIVATQRAEPAHQPTQTFYATRFSILTRYWDTIAIAGIVLFFTLLVARPFEVVVGVRDAGMYANTGFAIARTGSIVQTDPTLAGIAADQASSDPLLRDAAAQAETNFLAVQPRQRNIATRLRAAGFFINQGDLAKGRVVPQGFHLYPAWIGLLSAMTGLQGGLFATGLMGALGVWSIAMLGRRLAGPLVGVLGALFLALNGVQVWFSRYSTAETLTQFLTFAGLFFIAAMHIRPQPATNTQTAPSRAARFSALLAGLALGQLALARIDFALALAPVLVYLLYTWLRKRWDARHTWLAAGLGLMLLHAAIHIVTIARAYFFDTLFARLQDYALTALITLPFLTPALRDVFLIRPCSPLGIQPCPPVAGMEATTFTGWNYARIATEIGILVIVILALVALRRWGQRPLAFVEALVRRFSGVILSLSAIALLIFGSYAYLVRPQILNDNTLNSLPDCLTPEQLRAPQGACLALQGYVGAPVSSPAYIDPVAYLVESISRSLRGRKLPSPTECASLRNRLLPPEADGRTTVELIRDGLLDQTVVGPDAMQRLQACDPLVLRDLFANSQANFVRVGWYLSPLGILLSLVGLVLWWRAGMRPESWIFFAVALIGAIFFLRLTYGTSDQHYIYILRRYVPTVYPTLCLGIAYALTALTRLGRKTTPETRSSFVTQLGRVLAIALGLALVTFNIATNLKLYRHTEYAGALSQIQAIAQHFDTDDLILLRGGAPTYGAARDLPDNLATPLTYGFGLNAFTIKSAEPGNYANQLAYYVNHLHNQGRSVYLLLGASGSVALPGMQLEAVGPAQLALAEFEQPTNQKPTNIQEYFLDFMIYRVVPATTPISPQAILPGDYAAQVRGFYRTEQIDGQVLAWSNGDALLRLPWPQSAKPFTLELTLAPGATRPARLDPPQVCLSFRPEATAWVENPNAEPFSEPVCYRLSPGQATYSITIDPAQISPPQAGTFLLRITSDAWQPARDDPQQHDARLLGVQFQGLSIK